MFQNIVNKTQIYKTLKLSADFKQFANFATRFTHFKTLCGDRFSIIFDRQASMQVMVFVSLIFQTLVLPASLISHQHQTTKILAYGSFKSMER